VEEFLFVLQNLRARKFNFYIAHQHKAAIEFDWNNILHILLTLYVRQLLCVNLENVKTRC
jgi:hypothetical protein